MAACKRNWWPAPPEGHARWSLRLLADRLVELELIDSVSHETVRGALKKRTQAVEESRLGDGAASQRRIRGRHGKGAGHLQQALRSKAPVVCMDETPRQLIRETRQPIAAAPGRPQRHDYE